MMYDVADTGGNSSQGMVPSLLLVGKVEAAADWLASKHDALTVMTVLAAAARGAFSTDRSAPAHDTAQVSDTILALL
jgi:hypothetical protein